MIPFKVYIAFSKMQLLECEHISIHPHKYTIAKNPKNICQKNKKK